MRSQIAACRLAVRQLEELFTKYGSQTMLAAIDHIFAETEEKCRKIVAQIPDGVYEAESFYDDDSVALNEPIRVHARVEVDGDRMTIDLSGCSSYRKGGINSRTLAAARVAYKAMTAPLDAVNEGSFSALKVVIPEGNIMMAPFPAPMASWSLIVPTVVDTIFKALAPAMKDRIPAGTSRAARRLDRVLRHAARTPTRTSCCRAWKAAAGAAGRSRTASPAP